MRNYQKDLLAKALHKQSQAGQALLIVILVMTVALTIGLSVATRTITSLRTTAEEENSQRAFSAAEAGIEQALQNNASNSGSFDNNTTYKTSIETLSGAEFVLNNDVAVLKDNPVDLWLSNYPGYTSPWTGTLTIYWGSESDNCDPDESVNSMAALEIVLLHGTKATPQLTHYAVDPCIPPLTPENRAAVNKFEAISPGGGTVEGKTFAFKKTIPVTSGLLMRIIPLYAQTPIAVSGCVGNTCNALPSQGRLITSTGVSDTAERKIVGFQENPKLPIQIFPFVIFAPK